jgi:hypothetical protein
MMLNEDDIALFSLRLPPRVPNLDGIKQEERRRRRRAKHQSRFAAKPFP